jgi:hypothetical protein
MKSKANKKKAPMPVGSGGLLGGWVKAKTRLPKKSAAYPVITWAYPTVWTAGIFDKETGIWTDAMTKNELDIKIWYPLPNPNKGGESA